MELKIWELWNVLASSAICSWVDSKHVAQEADVDRVEGNAAMRETVDEIHRVQSCVTPPRWSATRLRT